jgi:diaminopimelate decarboxylase
MVMLDQTPVTLSNNHFSAHQFAQDLARKTSQQDAFFVADLGNVQMLVDEWISKMPRVQPFYAMNANSDELLLKVLASSGLGFHCSSRQQQELALDFVGPDRLFYTNANWTRASLAGALCNNVGLLGFDSEADLKRMANGKITNQIILNVRMDEESVIGCDVSKAPEILQLAADFELDCVGVSFNICSQRPGLFDSIFECAAQLFAIGRSMGLNMHVLNLGSGFPSPFAQVSPSFDQICDQINISLDYYFPQEKNQNVAIIATPGRCFVSSVYSLATRIVDKIETDASEITNDDFDAGQQAFIYKLSEGYYGPFGCRVVPNCNPECLPLFAELEEDQSPDLFYGRIHGPTNDELDVVQKQCQFKQMNAGDWLLWSNMGAYSMNNAESLDDEPCAAPQVYYFSKDSEWKFTDNSNDFSEVFPDTLENEPCCDDGESSETSEDSAIEVDYFWTVDWPNI